MLKPIRLTTLALLLLYTGRTLKLLTMKLLADFLRRLFGPSLTTLVGDLHVRLLNDWIMQSDASFIHLRCLWKLASGHPCEGVYEGRDFYHQYILEIDSAYMDWHETILLASQLAGSSLVSTSFATK